MHTKYGLQGSIGKGDPRAQVLQGRGSHVIMVGGGGVGDYVAHLNCCFATTYGALCNHTGDPYMHTKYGLQGSIGKGDPRAQVRQGRGSHAIRSEFA